MTGKTITANQFSTLVLTSPRKKLAKFKELSEPKGKGGDYYGPLRAKLKSAMKNERLKQELPSIRDYSKGSPNSVRFLRCCDGLKKMLEKNREYEFCWDSSIQDCLSTKGQPLSDSPLVLVDFKSDLVIKRPSSPTLICSVRYPYECTPTGRPQKPEMESVGIFLETFRRRLAEAPRLAHFEPALIQAASGQIYTLADVPANLNEYYDIEIQSIASYVDKFLV